MRKSKPAASKSNFAFLFAFLDLILLLGLFLLNVASAEVVCRTRREAHYQEEGVGGSFVSFAWLGGVLGDTFSWPGGR